MAAANRKKLIKNASQFIKNHPATLLAFFILCFCARCISLLHNRVIYLNIIFICLGIFLYEKTKKIIFLFLFIGIFIANEILYLLFNIDLYPSGDRTELCYSGNHSKKFFKNKQYEIMHNNLTEGIYPDGRCVSSDQAEINRFDLFIKLLNIKPGDRVLDAGCGHGNLTEYLREKNIDAYGITLTHKQYSDNIKKYGNHYFFGDYTHFHKELANKFDHIILPGSLEHPFGGNCFKESTAKNKSKKMTEMFEMFKRYFKPDSNAKNILITCIHSHSADNKLFKSMRNKIIIYCTERMFGGCYPTFGQYSVAQSLKNANYNVTEELDKTYDYYFSSYCDIKHFGNPFEFAMLLVGFPINQFIIHTYLYWKYGMWMWMWSNRLHKRRDSNEVVCEPSKSCDLYYEKDFNKRPCSLLYTVATCK